MKLVDTSSWIEYLRERKSNVSERVEALVLADEAAWCDMTAVELWHGARGAREKKELAALEQEITVLSIDSGVWQKARLLAIRLREAGVTVPGSDIIIAACAVHYKLELEFCDAHFDRILPIAAKR